MSHKERIREYLKQDVIWSKMTYDEDGDPVRDIYGRLITEDVDIKVRKVGKRRLTKDSTCKEIISETTILTIDETKVGEFIDGKEIISVLEIVDIDGNICGKEVLL